MPLWQMILLGLVALLALAIMIEAIVKRNRPKRNFVEKFYNELHKDDDPNNPEKPDLGMEAIDMDVIRLSERGNKSAAALGARDSGFWTRQTRRRKSKANPPDTGKET